MYGTPLRQSTRSRPQRRKASVQSCAVLGRGTPQTRSQRCVLRRNRIRSPTTSTTAALVCLIPVTLPPGARLSLARGHAARGCPTRGAAPIRCASKIAAWAVAPNGTLPGGVQKSTGHFSKKFSKQNPIPLPPTTSSRSERGWQTQRERETSLGVPRLALRGECCGWGASASRRGRRRGSVGRAPAPPGPRRLPVASSRPSQDPAGRNQPRPRCPAGPPPRRGRPWCGGTS